MFARSNIRPGIIKSAAVIYDPLATAFFAQIENVEGFALNTTEKTAVNNLSIRIKGLDPAYGNFGNDAIYQAALNFQICPMVGRNLNATKYNLMDPRNLTAARKQTYVGGCTADSYGVSTNGVNGYILSNIQQRAEADINSASACIGMVLKNNQARFDFGTYGTNYNAGGNDANLWLRGGNATTYMSRTYCYENLSSAAVDPRGHVSINLKDSQYHGRIYRNKVLLFTNAGNERYDAYNVENNDNLPFGAVSFNGTPSNLVNPHTMMFQYFFRGLTDSMKAIWDLIVEQYCIDMGRKTW